MVEKSVSKTEILGRARQGALALLICAGLSLTSSPGQGADGQGNFAVKGSGSATCQSYFTARESRDPAYLAFRSWINGYLTAYNQLVQGTYDIADGTDLEQMAAQLDQFCRQNPTQNFVTAVTAMTTVYREHQAQPRTGAAPAAPAQIDRATRRRVQQALKDGGYYDGPVDGLIGPGTRSAVRKFQEAQGLAVNGQLDQPTLTRLLQ